MDLSKKNTYIALAVALIVLIVAIAYFRHPGSVVNTESQNNVNIPAQQQAAPSPSMATGPFWTGTLKASDNAKKGNLMLVMDKTTVYINTSRDFSNLVGKQVKVTYQGTTSSFELGDITPQ